MFAGHLGVGLALKKAAPRLNLGVLLFASLFLDVLLGFLVLVGLEQIIVPNDYSQLHYLNFSFPYSHSLIALAVWTLVGLAVPYTGWLGEIGSKKKASLAISAAIFFHWLCDWFEHPPQLPVAGGNSKMLGLGLWNNLELAMALEVILVVMGILFYLSATRSSDKKKRWAIVGLISLLTAIAVLGQATVNQAPEPDAVAISIIVQILLATILAGWLDRDPQPGPTTR